MNQMKIMLLILVIVNAFLFIFFLSIMKDLDISSKSQFVYEVEKSQKHLIESHDSEDVTLSQMLYNELTDIFNKNEAIEKYLWAYSTILLINIFLPLVFLLYIYHKKNVKEINDDNDVIIVYSD